MMESFKELFEEYRAGRIDENEIGELHGLILKVYFESKENLNAEEQEYAEDLVFELYSTHKLEEQYHLKFKDVLLNDDKLRRKYLTLKNLESVENPVISMAKERIFAETEDEQEEKQLREILEGVIQKVHSEKEASGSKEESAGFIDIIKNFFRGLIPNVDFNLPQVKLVTIGLSVVLIAFFLWFVIDRKEQLPKMAEEQLTDSITRKKEKPDEAPKTDDIRQDLRTDMADNSQPFRKSDNQRMGELLAANYTTPKFDITRLRKETTDAADSFMTAADFFNTRNYETCSKILKDLLDRRSFKNPDTLSEIYFFLGNCYLIKGMKKSNIGLLDRSLQTFAQVNRQSKYHLPSRWYSVFAYAKSGNRNEACRIMDSLVQIRFPMKGNLKQLRDSICVSFLIY